MSFNSSIEWTDTTWNPVTGCTKVSAGCDRCYAERMSHRFHRPFTLTLHPDRLADPLPLAEASARLCEQHERPIP